MDSPSVDEGTDGTVVRYREPQPAHWAMWLLGLAMTGSLGIAYGYALGASIGLLTAGVASALVALVLVRSTVTIQVDDLVVRAGRARLPLCYIGVVRALDSDQTKAARGIKADPRAHLAIRSWIPEAVVIEVADIRDPHPYWLVSSNDPTAFAAAIQAAQATDA